VVLHDNCGKREIESLAAHIQRKAQLLTDRDCRQTSFGV
jgi:hypothetical protein